MHSRLRSSVPLLAALIIAAPPCGAQLYKWVDANGVTNYSNELPADPATVRNLMPVEDRVSVYKPDAALELAVRRARERGSVDAVADAPGPRVSVIGVTPPPAPPDPCAGRPNCQPVQGTYYPYPPVLVAPVRHRAPLFHPAPLRPGAIAGTAAGPDAFIPGNSAFAPARRTRSLPGAALIREP